MRKINITIASWHLTVLIFAVVHAHSRRSSVILENKCNTARLSGSAFSEWHLSAHADVQQLRSISCYTHTNAQIQRCLSACATCLNGSSTVQWFNGPSLVLCKKLILEKSLKHNITNSISNNVNHHNNKGSKYNTINVIWNKLNNKPCSRWLADQLTLTLTFQLLPLL